MVKSFIDVVQDCLRTRLGVPVRTKNPLSRTNTPLSLRDEDNSVNNTMFNKVKQIEFILNREVNINKFKFNLIHILSIGLINTAQAMGKIK